MAGGVGLLSWSSASPGAPCRAVHLAGSTCTDRGGRLQSAMEGVLMSGKRAHATHQGFSPIRTVVAQTLPASSGPVDDLLPQGLQKPSSWAPLCSQLGLRTPRGPRSHRRRGRRLPGTVLRQFLPFPVWLRPSHGRRVLRGWPSTQAAARGGGQAGRSLRRHSLSRSGSCTT